MAGLHPFLFLFFRRRRLRSAPPAPPRHKRGKNLGLRRGRSSFLPAPYRPHRPQHATSDLRGWFWRFGGNIAFGRVCRTPHRHCGASMRAASMDRPAAQLDSFRGTGRRTQTRRLDCSKRLACTAHWNSSRCRRPDHQPPIPGGEMHAPRLAPARVARPQKRAAGGFSGPPA